MNKEIEIPEGYEAALERCKQWVAGTSGLNPGASPKEVAEYLFPELAESEDEKIRKELIDHCIQGSKQRTIVSHKEDYKRWLAWLEKQKEQPTDAKLERVVKAARRVLNNWLDGTDCPDVSGDFAELEYAIREYDCEEKQKEQKPVNDRYMEGYMDGYAKGHKDAENSYNRAVSYHLDNPNIQRLDPNVVIESKTDGTYPDILKGTLTGGKSIEDKDAIEPTPKQDYSGLTDFERAIHRGFLCAGVENVPVDIIKDTAQDCLAHIKPAEWSEVDKIHLMNAICAAEKKWGIDSCTANWLKSLRPSWKPSKEQRHIEGQDTCYLDKQSLVDFIEDCIAENLENTTDANHDNHEGYHQACWDIIYRINQMCK